jgi:DNA polymerase-3 subunit gamma/tau
LLNATILHLYWRRKKKLKTFLDYPLFVRGLTKHATIKTKVSPNSVTSTKVPNQPSQKPSASAPVKPIPSSPTVTKATNTILKSRRKSIIRIKPQGAKEESKVVVNHGNEIFSTDALNKLWTEYSSKMKETAGGFSASILANCEPALLDDNKTIHLIFRNETNELEFNRLSLNLLEFLKSNLKNNHICFTTEVNKEKSKKVLYTSKDKFEHFSELEPKLLDWATRLGLELK